MKNITVILSHPRLEASSVMNKTIMEQLKKSFPQITYRHLDALYPNGTIDGAAEQKALQAADTIVLQFPIFWYFTPALLKAYMDTVWAPGFAFGEGGDKLKGKELFVIATTGSDEASYSAEGKPENYNRQHLKQYLFGFENAAAYMGMTYRGLVGAHCVGLTPESADANKKAAMAAADRFTKLLNEGGGACKVH